MSSIRSASSSTSTSIVARSTAPRSLRSSRRPGVAIKTVARRSSLIWVLMFAPPIAITDALFLTRLSSP